MNLPDRAGKIYGHAIAIERSSGGLGVFVGCPLGAMRLPPHACLQHDDGEAGCQAPVAELAGRIA
jgi:hypothetical protein